MILQFKGLSQPRNIPQLQQNCPQNSIFPHSKNPAKDISNRGVLYIGVYEKNMKKWV
jgi:hypothetical protein